MNGEEQVAAAKCDLAAEILSSFGILQFAATGWSMLPTIWPGDTLVVERVNPNQICVGNIVLVKREGRFCAHRVIAMSESTDGPHWTTQGDGMARPDRQVAEGEVAGRVRFLIRQGRRVDLPAKLKAAERAVAFAVRRSALVARALVRVHQLLQSSKRFAILRRSQCQHRQLSQT